MDKDELIAFLRANLTIELGQTTGFGPVEEIRVRLLLDGETISSDMITLSH